MKFSRIIGQFDPALIEEVEKNMSIIIMELASSSTMKMMGSRIGGDPLLFSLMYPVDHVATNAIPTAATDGKTFFWNPIWVKSLHLIGLRLVFGHEGFHGIFMHPQRRGARHPKLWNIAVDFVANGIIMQDLKYRGFDPASHFQKYLGNFLTLAQTIELYKNPLAFAKKMGWDIKNLPKADPTDTIYQPINPEIEAKDPEPKESPKFFYADPTLNDDDLRPEKIYDKLIKVIPRCPECGRLGIYYIPEKGDNDDAHEHDKDGSGGCGTCSRGYDIFDLGGDTLDEHIDVTETQEKMAKRITDAAHASKQMAGNIPGALETELGEMTSPKIRWQDVSLHQLHRSRAGNARNDYTRFKTRQMFAGLLVPKKRGYEASFAVLFDTSGSMSKDDKSYGLSQLISLDQRAEGVIVPVDSQVYWNDAVKLKRLQADNLLTVKTTGGGGTRFAPFFEECEKRLGKQSFIAVITDGMLDAHDLATMKEPSCPVYWIVVSAYDFKAPFGRVFSLHN